MIASVALGTFEKFLKGWNRRKQFDLGEAGVSRGRSTEERESEPCSPWPRRDPAINRRRNSARRSDVTMEAMCVDEWDSLFWHPNGNYLIGLTSGFVARFAPASGNNGVARDGDARCSYNWACRAVNPSTTPAAARAPDTWRKPSPAELV